MRRILAGILCFFACFWGNTTEAASLLISMQRGEFIPIRALTLKTDILPAKIWKDDASILRFVSTDTPLSNRAYRPQGLVSLSGAHINQAGRSSLIRSDIKPHLDALAAEFYQEFHEPLIAVSAFRSAEYQQRLWDLWRCDAGAFCAKPGHSEHQLGLTLDFFDASSEEAYVKNPRYRRFVEWMRAHAHHHGWTQSYQHWPLIDGYEIEPWHWRYIGAEMAWFLRAHNMSYTRYLQWNRIIGAGI